MCLQRELPTHHSDCPHGAGINDCTAPKKGAEPKCGPTHGQVEYGQSYLCVSLNAPNLDAVAKVLRGNGLVLFASNIAGAADQLPNVAALIDQDAQGDQCLPTLTYLHAGACMCWGRPSMGLAAKATGLRQGQLTDESTHALGQGRPAWDF